MTLNKLPVAFQSSHSLQSACSEVACSVHVAPACNARVLTGENANAGLLDAGGRNVTVGLRSSSGYFRRTSCVGVMLFLQYWYWYPLSYCLSLALQPSALIGLNADLKLPKMQVRHTT